MNSNNYKQIFLNFIVFFFPISYLFGKVFVEFTLVLFALFTIINLKKWKNYFFERNYIIFLLFLFYLVIFISTINNIEILSKTTDQNLLLKSFLNFRFIIYIISVWFVLKEVKFNKSYYFIAILFYLIFIIDAYIQFVTGSNLLGYSISSGRISGIFNDEYILGSYIQKVIPLFIILFLLIFKNNFTNNIYLLLVISLSSIIILFSGDRSAVILFIFFLFLCTIFLSTIRKVFLINFLLSSLIVFFIISFDIGKNLNSLDQRYNPKSQYNEYTLQKINPSPFIKYLPRDYLGHYLVVKEMVKDNLYIGKGIKSFRFMCRGKLGNFYPVENGICSTHPHNYYLQSMSSGGLIGFIFLFSIFVLFFWKMGKNFFILIKRKSENRLLTLSTICLFVYFWPLIPTGNFFSNWVAGFNCFALGVFLFINSKFKTGKNE